MFDLALDFPLHEAIFTSGAEELTLLWASSKGGR